MTTILTLRLDAATQAWFDAQRRAHYPAHLNRIAAHLTLFHALPADDTVRSVLEQISANVAPFAPQVTGLRSLGRGVMYTVQSPELAAMHRTLATAFAEHLTPQDRQPFRPHVVIQNKVIAEAARTLLAELQPGFTPRTAQALGLEWWEYLGGPWKPLSYFPFQLTPDGAPVPLAR